jgi:glycosyltransferase involved in cell wall biosynthesis
VDKKYRIAIVANTTWNIYNFRQNVIRKLIDEGHEVIVMAPVDKYISYHEKFHQLRHVPLRKLKRDSVNPIRDLQLASELTRLYKEHKPDLVIHYTVKPNIYGGVAAWLAGVPSIAVVTGLGYAFLHNGFIQKTTTRLYKWTSKFHRRVVFENDDDLALFVKLGLLKQSKGVSVNGCGVDTELFKPQKNILASKEKVIFSFIGRLLYDKGIKEFIDAAHLVKAQHENVSFWIFGELDRDNPSAINEKDLVQWVKDEAIEYHGATENIKKYMQLSDCVVLPSYREGMSRVIMEAMSMERPVITSDTPGCRQAITDGETGFIVPVKDHLALAEAMTKFIDLPAEYKRQMGIKGRNRAVEIFDEKIVAEQITEIIDNVLKESGS